jgi:hypothetical protein
VVSGEIVDLNLLSTPTGGFTSVLDKN